MATQEPMKKPLVEWVLFPQGLPPGELHLSRALVWALGLPLGLLLAVILASIAWGLVL